jgi:hypothetical protein
MAQPRLVWKTSGDRSIASARLRAFLPYEALHKEGLAVGIYDSKSLVVPSAIIFQKAYTREDIALAKRLKDLGCKVLLDQCDNHFYNPLGDALLADRAARLADMNAICDAVICSTPQIASLFPNKETLVIEDYVEAPKFSSIKHAWLKWYYRNLFSNKEAIHLVWFGNAGGEYPRFGLPDIAALLPELERLSKQTPISLTIISNSKKLFDDYFRKTTIPVFYVEWERKSYEYLLSFHDLCLIPIDHNPFTNCKSNNRLVLALLLGVPVIADTIPSYEELRPYYTEGDWTNSIASFKSLKESHLEKVKDGKAYIQDHYTSKSITQKWVKLYNDIVEKKE